MPTGSKRNPDIPQIDFETVRETLNYIHDDVSRFEGLEHVAIAMREAISQIEIAEVRHRLPDLRVLRNMKFMTRSY